MEEQVPQDDASKRTGSSRPKRNTPTMWILFVVLLVAVLLVVTTSDRNYSEIHYSFFYQQVADGNVEEVEFRGEQLYGTFVNPPIAPTKKGTLADQKGTPADGKKAAQKTPPSGADPQAGADKEKQAGELERLNKNFRLVLPPVVGEQLEKHLRENDVKITARSQSDGLQLMMFAWLIIPLLLLIGFFVMARRREQMLGGGLFSGFTKSPAKKFSASDKSVTFDDVAGLEEVKSDLQEVVEFLKNPEKFQRLGGRVPKGVLLEGPPGTGKTLLARAVAGEAGVPFYSISGSEFIQLFVGVGAGRVRDLFKTAKESSPAILFIDEIDAVGRERGAGYGGGHDEREQTLNQILSEMDGFSPTESVIVLAATNRPDVLDPALLRPGRFDRRVTVDAPSKKGRKEIFAVHTRDVPLADDVDLDRLAAATIGLTGADIRNLVNEAALWATRMGKDKVDMSDMEYARDKILMGPKREDVLEGKEKTMTAYHEAGHALVAWLEPRAEKVHKVTIIPHGRALGVTQLIPEEDRRNIGESDLHGRLMYILGGRAAEKLIFDEYSAGAENDLKMGTRLARKMVTHWGMSERLGPVAFRTGEEHPFLGREIIQEHREFSEHTAQVVDEEISRIMQSAYERATETLRNNRDKLDTLAKTLEEKETLDTAELEAILGPAARHPSSNGQPHHHAAQPASESANPVSGDGDS